MDSDRTKGINTAQWVDTTTNTPRRLPERKGPYANTKLLKSAPSICTQPKGGYHWGGYN